MSAIGYRCTSDFTVTSEENVVTYCQMLGPIIVSGPIIFPRQVEPLCYFLTQHSGMGELSMSNAVLP